MWGAAPAESEKISSEAGSNDIFIFWPLSEIYGLTGGDVKNNPPDHLNQVYLLQTRVSASEHVFTTPLK
ncbi:hypothetical protein CWR41_00085 [Cedecea lapagei]|nr:hypothetical protein CWR41_00085 [Cedecea lapagei]